MNPTSSISPQVSVVIGVFNEVRTISATLASVLGQTMQDLECIVVDDASRDNTAAVALAIAERDPRVRVVRLNVNGGLTRALRRGVDEARGVWLARIDAGDTWRPEKLARQLAHAARHPDTGLIGCWSEDINQQTDAVTLRRKPEAHADIVAMLWRACPFIHSTILVRLDTVRACGNYDPAFACSQDYDLYFRLLFQTQGHNLPEVLCQRPTHGDTSISCARWKEQVRSSLRIRWNYYRQHDRPWRDYARLLPDLGKLLLPASFKRLKQRAIRGPHAR